MSGAQPVRTKGLRILLVDDDDLFRKRLARALESRGYEVVPAECAERALSVAGACALDGAIVDLRMPGDSGLTLVPALLERHPDVRVLVLTGYGSIATALEAVKLGAVNYMMKPADADQILAGLGLAAGSDQAPSIGVPSLSRVEWEHINRVLVDCGGNITRAAKLLGIHRRSLQRKLSKLP